MDKSCSYSSAIMKETPTIKFKDWPLEQLIIIARHICRISGEVCVKSMLQYFREVEARSTYKILEHLLESGYIKRIREGIYEFIESDNLDELQEELDLLEKTKAEVVLATKKYIQNGATYKKTIEDTLESPHHNSSTNRSAKNVSSPYKWVRKTESTRSQTMENTAEDSQTPVSGATATTAAGTVNIFENKLKSCVASPPANTQSNQNVSVRPRTNSSASSLFQWTRPPADNAHTNPREAVELYCYIKQLQRPIYTIKYIETDDVYYCTLLVGSQTYRSYPTKARTEKRALEIAAEKAVAAIGLTSSILLRMASSKRLL